MEKFEAKVKALFEIELEKSKYYSSRPQIEALLSHLELAMIKARGELAAEDLERVKSL